MGIKLHNLSSYFKPLKWTCDIPSLSILKRITSTWEPQALNIVANKKAYNYSSCCWDPRYNEQHSHT